MTLENLKLSVEKLCFVEEVESLPAFYHAVNRSVSRARSVFPKIKRFEVANFPLKNTLKNTLGKTFEIKGEREFFSKDLTSYYFEGLGKGKMTVYYFNSNSSVNDYEELMTVEINSPNAFKKYKGLIKRFDSFVFGDFKVKFHGNFHFHVRNLALYDSLKSDNSSDIPDFCEEITLDLGKITQDYGKEIGKSVLREDFIGFATPPYLKNGENNMELKYVLSNKLMTVSRKDVGVIAFDYFALPETVGEFSMDTDEVDYPPILANACAYLVSANLLMEDDPDLATKYLAQYLEAEEAAKTLNSVKGGCYKNTNGWC